MVDIRKLSVKAKRAIGISQSLAKENGNSSFGAAHLLKAVLHDDLGLVDFLTDLRKDVHELRAWADVRISKSLKSPRREGEPQADESSIDVLARADSLVIQIGEQKVTPICILAAICEPSKHAFTAEQLKSLHTTKDEIVEAWSRETEIERAIILDEY